MIGKEIATPSTWMDKKHHLKTQNGCRSLGPEKL